MDAAADRLRTAFELHEFGVSMQRQRFRRARPEATEEKIDDQLRVWLRDRPGAQDGDCTGTPSRRFG